MSVNDESFVHLPLKTKRTVVKEGCHCHQQKKAQLQMIPVEKIWVSSNKLGNELKYVMDNDYHTSWKGNDGLAPGESVFFQAACEFYTAYLDVLFKDPHLRSITFAVYAQDGDKMVCVYQGTHGPVRTQNTPIRVQMTPTKTNIVQLKTISYTVAAERGKNVSYPNPEVSEVRILGYLTPAAKMIDFSNRLDVIVRPYFVAPPDGYYFDSDNPFGVAKSIPSMLSPTAIRGLSAIEDSEVIALDGSNKNAASNLSQLPLTDKWSGKGVGSTVLIEFDQHDLKKFKRPALLKQLKLAFYQAPPRSYRVLIRIYNQVGLDMSKLPTTPAVYQNIIEVQSGMGDIITVPLNNFKDVLTNTKKTVAISMLETSNKKKWFSLTLAALEGESEEMNKQ